MFRPINELLAKLVQLLSIGAKAVWKKKIEGNIKHLSFREKCISSCFLSYSHSSGSGGSLIRIKPSGPVSIYKRYLCISE